MMNPRTLSAQLINKALEYGASLAGIANIEDLKKMPSFVVTPQRPHIERVGAVENETGLPEGVVAWPEGMKSVLVLHFPIRRTIPSWTIGWTGKIPREM